MSFPHEKLRVYQKAISFVAWTNEFLTTLPKGSPIKDQLDRAAISIPLNIAEGNAKLSNKDRCRFLQYARGSFYECAACLDVIIAKNWIEESELVSQKEELSEIAGILGKLMRNFGAKFNEDSPVWGIVDLDALLRS